MPTASARRFVLLASIHPLLIALPLFAIPMSWTERRTSVREESLYERVQEEARS